jgi:hypothetical protein
MSTLRTTSLTGGDEPHFRAGLFVPNYNADGDSRLLNVAPP